MVQGEQEGTQCLGKDLKIPNNKNSPGHNSSSYCILSYRVRNNDQHFPYINFIFCHKNHSGDYYPILKINSGSQTLNLQPKGSQLIASKTKNPTDFSGGQTVPSLRVWAVKSETTCWDTSIPQTCVSFLSYESIGFHHLHHSFQLRTLESSQSSSGGMAPPGFVPCSGPPAPAPSPT